MLLGHCATTASSLGDDLSRSQTLSVSCLRRRSGSCIRYARKNCLAYLGRDVLHMSRGVAYELRNTVRAVPVPAAVAEHDLANQVSEGVVDTNHVQVFLQWLAIQGQSPVRASLITSVHAVSDV